MEYFAKLMEYFPKIVACFAKRFQNPDFHVII